MNIALAAMVFLRLACKPYAHPQAGRVLLQGLCCLFLASAAAALVMLHESSNNPSLAIVTCIGVAVLAVNALYAASVLWQLVGVVEWGIRKSLQRFVGMAVVQHAPAERLQLQRAEGQGCGRAAAGASSGCKDVDCSAAADSGKP